MQEVVLHIDDDQMINAAHVMSGFIATRLIATSPLHTIIRVTNLSSAILLLDRIGALSDGKRNL